MVSLMEKNLKDKNLDTELWCLYQDMLKKIIISDSHEEIWRLSNIIANTPPEVCEEIGGEHYLGEIAKLDKNNKEDIFIWKNTFKFFHENWEDWNINYKMNKIFKKGSLTDIMKYIIDEAHLSAWSEYANAAFIGYDCGDPEAIKKHLEYLIKRAIRNLQKRFPEDKKANKVIKILRNKDTELDLRIMAAYCAASR